MKAERMCQLFPTSPIHQSVTTNEPIHQVQRVGEFSIQKSLLGKTNVYFNKNVNSANILVVGEPNIRKFFSLM